MEEALNEDDIELIEVEDLSGVEEVNGQTAATLEVLRELSVFAELPHRNQIRLAERVELVQHAPGVEVVRVGAAADALYVVVQGRARVEVPGLAKAESIELGPGEIFGEACLFASEPRHATVRAQSALGLLQIPKAAVDALVREHPETGDRLLELFMRRLIGNLMKTNPVFTCLEPRTRRDLAQLFETRKAAPGTVLIEEGQRVDGMYIPLTGKLELSARGSSKQVAAGSVVGQGSMLSHSPSRYAVKTVGDCVLLRLPADRFMDLITQYPPVLELLASRALIAAG